MGKQMLKVWLLVSAISMILPAQEPASVKEVLERARQEQMFVSRMLKDIVLIASHYLHKEQTIGELERTKKEYSEGLKQLQQYENTPEWKTMMATAWQEWDQAQKLTEGAPDKKRAMEYIKKFSKLKLQWNKPIGYLMKEAKMNADNPVSVLSNFKIYSEQMTTMYLLRSWDLNDPSRVDKSSHRIGIKVHQGFQTLLKSPQTTPKMKEVIRQMRKLSLYFQVMWDSNVRTPTLVVKKSKEAYQLAVKLLRMYRENP